MSTFCLTGPYNCQIVNQLCFDKHISYKCNKWIAINPADLNHRSQLILPHLRIAYIKNCLEQSILLCSPMSVASRYCIHLPLNLQLITYTHRSRISNGKFWGVLGSFLSAPCQLRKKSLIFFRTHHPWLLRLTPFHLKIFYHAACQTTASTK